VCVCVCVCVCVYVRQRDRQRYQHTLRVSFSNKNQGTSNWAPSSPSPDIGETTGVLFTIHTSKGLTDGSHSWQPCSLASHLGLAWFEFYPHKVPQFHKDHNAISIIVRKWMVVAYYPVGLSKAESTLLQGLKPFVWVLVILRGRKSLWQKPKSQAKLSKGLLSPSACSTTGVSLFRSQGQCYIK
jgi:hypothetical protein